MVEANTGFCEMEIGGLTGAFEKADQQRRTFCAHFCLAGAEAETSVFTHTCHSVKG